MKECKIFDLHCDTLLRLWRTGERLESCGGHIDLERLRRGGAGAQCFAAFIVSHGEAEELGAEGDHYEFFLRLEEIFRRETAANSGAMGQALSAGDIEKNLDAGRISAILTVEDGALLEGDIRRLDGLWDKGVRMLALTWNYENCIGYPNSSQEATDGHGLKPFGRECVDRMERLGMIVDVSHLSQGGFWDVAEQMKGPFIASHSCAKALCDNSRNLSDRQLRAIGDHGGVCGVNFYSRFLREGSDRSEIEDIVRHMAYISDRAGIESVAIGSDLDGIDCQLELGDYGGMDLLRRAMARRFTQDQMELICYKNALRVFRDTVG